MNWHKKTSNFSRKKALVQEKNICRLIKGSITRGMKLLTLECEEQPASKVRAADPFAQSPRPLISFFLYFSLFHRRSRRHLH